MSSIRKVALVTGAGSGIGRKTTLALLKAGYSVVLAGRRAEALETTVAEAGADGSRTLVVPADVTDPASVRAAFAEIKRAYGRLDLVFNNAGVGAPGIELEDLTYEQWRSVVDTNLTGTFLCTQEAFKIMKDQKPRGGRIINNGSVSAHVPRPNSAPYTATKHGITGLTRSTALDGRKYNIACGQIDIGNAAIERNETDQDGRLPKLQPDGKVAAEPKMDADNVAVAVVYMASLSLDANVQFMTIMATKMPYIGRG